MPFIEVTLAQGRTDEQLRDLMRRVHDTVEDWGAPAASIRIIVREIPPTLWSAGGVTLAEARGLK